MTWKLAVASRGTRCAVALPVAFSVARVATAALRLQVNIKSLNKREIERVMAEIRFLKTLKHDCLIKFFSAFSKDDDRIIFITELMTSGTLHECVARVGVLGLRSLVSRRFLTLLWCSRACGR